jgi:hypothetical protein
MHRHLVTPLTPPRTDATEETVIVTDRALVS